MTTQDFSSASPVDKNVNRKTFTDGNKVQWFKICWIQTEKENPQVVIMKLTHNEDYSFLTLVPKWEEIGKGEA